MGRRQERVAAAVAAAATIWVLASTLALAAPPRVLWVKGVVTARTLGEGPARALELQPMDLLPNKARVVVRRGSSLWFMDGEDAVGLHGPGSWELPNAKLHDGEGKTTRVSLAALELEREPRVPWVEVETPIDAHAVLAPMSPVETGVTTRRPVLRWRAAPGVRRVNLTLSRRDLDGTTHPVERWRGLTGTHHEVSRPLEPGHDYRWELQVGAQVSADGGGESPELRTKDPAEAPPDDPTSATAPTRAQPPTQTSTWFHVLSDEAIRAVRGADSAVSRYQLDTPEATAALEVVRALVWEHHGLVAEARTAWDEILAQTGDVEALRLYRARLGLRALGAPRAVGAHRVTPEPPKQDETQKGEATPTPDAPSVRQAP